MKKIIALLLVVCMLGVTMSFVACTQNDADNQNDNQNQEENNQDVQGEEYQQGAEDDQNATAAKKLVVGVDDQMAPMAFRDEDGNITGFDIDYLTAAANEMGYEIEFQAIDWSSKFMELEAGKIDVIASGFTIDEERKTQCTILEPYLANAQVIVTKADSEIAAKADLAGKVVGVQTDSTAVNALEKDEINSQIGEKVEYPDNVSILNDVKIGRLDAAVLDVVVASYYANIEADTFKILDESLAPEEYGYGVKNGNDELAAALQAGINAINDNGTAATISEKWFGQDIVLKAVHDTEE